METAGADPRKMAIAVPPLDLASEIPTAHIDLSALVLVRTVDPEIGPGAAEAAVAIVLEIVIPVAGVLLHRGVRRILTALTSNQHLMTRHAKSEINASVMTQIASARSVNVTLEIAVASARNNVIRNESLSVQESGNAETRRPSPEGDPLHPTVVAALEILDAMQMTGVQIATQRQQVLARSPRPTSRAVSAWLPRSERCLPWILITLT